MAKFCTNCGSEIKPGAKFCENCGQKLDYEQNQQEGAGGIAAAAGAVGAAGAASSADTSYKKSIGDSHDNFASGAKADAAQVNNNTDGQANTYNNFAADNQQKPADERLGGKDDNASADYNTPPRAGKKFLNLGEGLDLLFKDSLSKSCKRRTPIIILAASWNMPSTKAAIEKRRSRAPKVSAAKDKIPCTTKSTTDRKMLL